MLQPALNFGADNHFICRDNPRQHDFAPVRNDGKIDARRDGGCDQQYKKEFALHGQPKGSLDISPPRRKPFRAESTGDFFTAAYYAAQDQHSNSIF
jgi:hypothetical protein